MMTPTRADRTILNKPTRIIVSTSKITTDNGSRISVHDKDQDLGERLILLKRGLSWVRYMESTPSIAPTFASSSPSSTFTVIPTSSPSFILTENPSSLPTDNSYEESSSDQKKDEEESLGIFFGLMALGFVFLGYKAYQRRKRQLLLRDRHVISSDPNSTNSHLSEFYIDDNELI